jgi:hypothetical protein
MRQTSGTLRFCSELCISGLGRQPAHRPLVATGVDHNSGLITSAALQNIQNHIDVGRRPTDRPLANSFHTKLAMGTPPRPPPKRARQKVLLIYGGEHLRGASLERLAPSGLLELLPGRP